MKKLIIILLLGGAVWQFYLSKPGSPIISNIASDGSVMDNPVVSQPGASIFSLDSRRSSTSQPATQVANSNYRCDGRTRCSQMTSCATAQAPRWMATMMACPVRGNGAVVRAG